MPMVSNQQRNYSQFAGRPDEFKRKKNLFDLSHDHKTTFSMGQLVPILTLETMPGDSFEIEFEVMCRFAPLYLPIMHRCDMTIHYFYVPNRILWSWNGQHGGEQGSAGNWADYISQNQDLIAPYIVVPTADVRFEKSLGLLGYMGYPLNNIIGGGASITNDYVNAFPFAAFWKIYDEYYRNSQVEAAMSYPLVAGQNDLSDWPNYYDDPTNDHGLFVPYKLWNRDYFTSALPTPQLGAEVLVPMYNPDYLTPNGLFSPDGPWRMRLESTDAVAGAGTVTLDSTAYGTDAPGFSTNPVTHPPSYIDVQETAATMRQFRLAARMLEFLERLMRTGTRYRDFLKGHFGVDPDPGTVDLPVYIGGSKGRVIISEVMATASTTNDLEFTPLGSYAGQALTMEGSKQKVKYFCKEHGIILGIINIQPRSSYMQGLSRMWTRGVNNGGSVPNGTVFDYPFTEFAGIGDQAILYKELRRDFNNVAANIAHNEETFGYIPRYSEYRWHNDLVTGEMRTLWISFHLTRIFTEDATLSLTEPVLNREFVSCRPRVDDVFQIAAAQDHEIYCHIFNNVQVWRALPKFGVPSL